MGLLRSVLDLVCIDVITSQLYCLVHIVHCTLYTVQYCTLYIHLTLYHVLSTIRILDKVVHGAIS